MQLGGAVIVKAQHVLKPLWNIDVCCPVWRMQRMKKAHALNVVGMTVRDKQMANATFRKLFTSKAQACSGIKKQDVPTVCAQFNTGSIAAIK